jgi:hypothetical protein
MGNQTFNSTACFTVPNKVTQLCVQTWGSGGKGAPGYCICICGPVRQKGAGGGGGGYGKGVIPVTPGTKYNVKVGSLSFFPACLCSHVIGNCCREVGAHGGSTACQGSGGAGGSGFGNATTVSHTGGTGLAQGCGGHGACPCGGAGGTGCAGCGHAPGGGSAGHICSGSGSPGAQGLVKLAWCCPAPCCPTPSHGGGSAQSKSNAPVNDLVLLFPVLRPGAVCVPNNVSDSVKKHWKNGVYVP